MTVTTYFAFAIADSMFPPNCSARRRPLSVEEVRALLPAARVCVNPAHKPTIDAAVHRFGLVIAVPERADPIALIAGDRVIVMSQRGLPRLEGRREYTTEEIAGATFAFGLWEVLDGG